MSTKEELIDEWNTVRRKTYEFLETVSDEKMIWRPHELLGTFGMQLRHMIKSQESYIKGIKSGKIDFSEKSFEKELETNKQRAVETLKDLDNQLIDLIKTESLDKEITFVDGVHGEMKIPLSTVIAYLVDHEFYHQGIFTCYGRLAGLGKFTFM